MSVEQQYACIAHECGHLILANTYSTYDCLKEEICPQEIFCDNIANLLCLAKHMLSALDTMEQCMLVCDYEIRKKHLLSYVAPEKVRWIYRPVWTCGKYNAQKEVAIYYNCLSGNGYFFEGCSANLIGKIQSLGRCDGITETELAASVDATVFEIESFINELISLGLVLDEEPTKNIRISYRQYCANNIKHNSVDAFFPKEEQSTMEISDAESLYADKVGGVTSIMLELTYRCSERCIHCYNYGAAHCDGEVSKRGTLKELSLAEYKNIIDQFDSAGVFRVTISGGDPFAREDNIAWEIMKYLYEKDIAFDIYTNGQQLIGLEDKLANLFPKLVGISIYSGQPEVHDMITRVNGSFNKSLMVMEKLASLSIPMYLKCCVFKHNIDTYSSVFDIAERVNAVPQIEINIFDGVDGNKYVSEHLRLSPEEIMKLLDDKRTLQSFDISIEDLLNSHRDLSKNACQAGLHTFNITPDGDVTPCCVFHMTFGNLKIKSLENILNESMVRKQWLSKTLNDYEDCGRFEYCSFCSLCPGHNYSEHGTPLKPSENNCFLAKIKYQYAIKKISQC